jgi:hypothetical protein
VFLRRLVPFGFVFALLASVMLLPAAASGTPAANASKKSKKCPQGKKLVTVTKKGKKAKVCKKVKGKAPAPAPAPAPSHSLFEAPGKTLEGKDTLPFLQKYLPNSTFTDCVRGWPECGGFENRFSHATDNTFYKCLLRPTSGSDVKSVGEYGVSNARVNPDGSWIVQEVVGWYGYQSSFEWSVSTTGVVEGAYSSHPGETPEKIGPLIYVGGVAKNCEI